MAAIADTGFLFALVNTQDEHHRKVINVVRRLSEPVILPLTVLPEICYLLDTRLGHPSMRQFVANVLTGAMELTSLNKTDIARALKILQQYGDTRFPDNIYGNNSNAEQCKGRTIRKWRWSTVRTRVI